MPARAEEARQRELAVQREAEAKSARLAESEQRAAAEQERDKATTLNQQLQSLTQEQRRTIYAVEVAPASAADHQTLAWLRSKLASD